MSAERETWIALRRLTAARIGLKCTGAALATAPLLEFQLAHARARDAVHDELDTARLAAALDPLGLSVLTLASAAADRRSFLMRPDLGRQLANASVAALTAHRGTYDVAFVVADGLSARAVQSHACPVLAAVLLVLRTAGWTVAPLVIVHHSRVAAGDAVGNLLGAAAVVVLIGERPGLTAPDSMGAYLTWQPRADTTDAKRNCISNIRPEGIGYDAAAFKIVHLLRAMRARKLSGVALKDDSDRLLLGG
ncbi:MAG TPA: ethanolamine ammonia-lyase subunit EutC [Xanthobacteraceae bacterium]|jgi:ethanolamine ammonia-lyase small subunit|nr:ethanolamine ammonia-lyase subunit EutC [Xanthobacteraceae bacterium]